MSHSRDNETTHRKRALARDNRATSAPHRKNLQLPMNLRPNRWRTAREIDSALRARRVTRDLEQFELLLQGNGDATDMHRLRAIELANVGMLKQAGAVIRCSAQHWDRERTTQRGPKACGKRLCPTCRQRQSLRMRSAGRAAQARMQSPLRLVVTYHGARGERLRRLWEELSDRFSRFRRRKVARLALRDGFRVIEPLRRDGRWLLHIHLVVDQHDRDVDIAALNAAWRALAGDRQKISTPPGAWRVRRGDAHMAYLAKLRREPDWSPDPGTLDLDEFEDLVHAVHGRQLFAAYGRCRPAAATRGPASSHSRERRGEVGNHRQAPADATRTSAAGPARSERASNCAREKRAKSTNRRPRQLE